jgi:rhamnogalacturonyl hydrolase YesR
MSERFSKLEALIHRRRRESLALAAVIIVAVGGISYEALKTNVPTITAHNQSQSIEQKQLNNFLNQAGQSLIDRHEDSRGGWRFKSEIQAPHFQTDRDVGAASVGMGFLALYEANPQDEHWLNGAKQTATWLMAVSSQDSKEGRYWHDYVDDQETSSNIYTSFDDGAIGIGDFFWQLYEKTKVPEYKQVAIETVQWTLSQAEPYGQGGYRWKWDVSDPNSPYYMGMGEGAAGITYALATYSQRFQQTDPALSARCKTYADGSQNYIESVRQRLAKIIATDRTIPETSVAGQDGDTTLDSGYLSGAAGDAFMYLNLYKIYGDKKYLDDVSVILGWLSDTNQGPMVKAGENSLAWKLALDTQGGDDNHYATGVEEGNAGIGWTYLQAYKLTHDKTYLQTAEDAANWLMEVAIKSPRGSLSWHEDENSANPLVHANLNNGTAGIGMFLQDMYLVTGNQNYRTAAQGVYQWLTQSAKHNGRDIYWQDNGGGGPYSNDPSWHWGTAGIIEFAQRMSGGPQDILGEQPGLDSKVL